MNFPPSNLDIACQTLLEPNGINDTELQRILSKILGHQVDYADLYFQNSRQESFVLEDGLVKEGGYDINYGVGIRAVAGEKTGFAYSDDILLTALDSAASAARTIAQQGGGHQSIQTLHQNQIQATL